jgi:hypothetical protein
MQTDRDYENLDEMARAEGVEAVLKFLAYRPTMIGGIYRHTRMPIVPFIVKEDYNLSAYLKEKGK